MDVQTRLLIRRDGTVLRLQARAGFLAIKQYPGTVPMLPHSREWCQAKINQFELKHSGATRSVQEMGATLTQRDGGKYQQNTRYPLAWA
jgi:hypothetical protein